MRAKKKLGQHFLRTPSVIARIVDALEAKAGDRFLEIGPGPATLTRPLTRKGFGLTAVEYDPEMATYLRRQDFDQPVTIIEADFMDLPLASLIGRPTKVVSNLPYNVSVPITAKLLGSAPGIPLMVMMYQKEVAARIRAQPHAKDYGPISVLAQCFYRIDLHFDVAPGAFWPRPKVVSQVLRFRLLDRTLIPVSDLQRLTELVRFLFIHRRKMIGTTLKKWKSNWTETSSLLESLHACGFKPSVRPQELSPDEYVKWFQNIKEQNDRSTSK